MFHWVCTRLFCGLDNFRLLSKHFEEASGAATLSKADGILTVGLIYTALFPSSGYEPKEAVIAGRRPLAAGLTHGLDFVEDR